MISSFQILHSILQKPSKYLLNKQPLKSFDTMEKSAFSLSGIFCSMFMSTCVPIQVKPKFKFIRIMQHISKTYIILTNYSSFNINCTSFNKKYTYWVKVLLPTRHKIDHFGDVLPSQSPGTVLKKLNLRQQNQTYTKKWTWHNPKKLNLTQINCNTQYNHGKAKSNQQTTVHMCVHCTVHNNCYT